MHDLDNVVFVVLADVIELDKLPFLQKCHSTCVVFATFCQIFFLLCNASIFLVLSSFFVSGSCDLSPFWALEPCIQCRVLLFWRVRWRILGTFAWNYKKLGRNIC